MFCNGTFDAKTKDKSLNSNKESKLSAVKTYKNTIVSLNPSHKNLFCTFKRSIIFDTGLLFYVSNEILQTLCSLTK